MPGCSLPCPLLGGPLRAGHCRCVTRVILRKVRRLRHFPSRCTLNDNCSHPGLKMVVGCRCCGRHYSVGPLRPSVTGISDQLKPSGFGSKLELKRGYSTVMPGGRRIGRPSGPVAAAAVVVIIFILLWVLFSNLGWMRYRLSSAPQKITRDDRALLWYAVLDDSVGCMTGHSLFFVDGKEIGKVPCLAICQDSHSHLFTLYYCDRDWKPVGVAPNYQSVDAAKHRAERIYPGSAAHWVERRP